MYISSSYLSIRRGKILWMNIYIYIYIRAVRDFSRHIGHILSFSHPIFSSFFVFILLLFKRQKLFNFIYLSLSVIKISISQIIRNASPLWITWKYSMAFSTFLCSLILTLHSNSNLLKSIAWGLSWIYINECLYCLPVFPTKYIKFVILLP